MLILSDLQIGYQNIPKVATTSMFNWMYACVSLIRTGEIPSEPMDRRKLFLSTKASMAVTVDNLPAAVAPFQDHFRFALTRDPVRRFLSMYSNRVLHHGELAEDSPRFDRVGAAGLAPTPEINVLVDRLEAYCQTQGSIAHHSRPMMEFLGPDLSVYDRIADLAEINTIIDELKAHFVARGLGAALTNAPSLGRSQTGGPKLGLDVLNPYSFEKLLDFYREDYAKIPTVDLQATKDAWHKARDQAFVSLAEAVRLAVESAGRGGKAARDDVDAPDAGRVPGTGKAKGGKGKGKGKVKAGRKAVPAKAGMAAKPQATVKKGAGNKAGKRAAGKPAGGLKIEYVACPVVQKIRIAPQSPAAGSCMGFLLLKPPADAGYSLVLAGPSGEQPVEWHLASPKLAGQFPDNPGAKAARFRASGLVANAACELRLNNAASGESLLIARVLMADAGAA